MDTFDATRPLPSGTTLLEASAGTGKTHAITSIVARLVAVEGIDLRTILVVTFTRAAAAELRDRIRSRLRGLARALCDGDPDDDPLLVHLGAGEPGEVTARAERLDQAVASIDDATITTIHGFAQRALRRGALEAGAGVDVEVATDTEDLRTQVADDLYDRLLHDADPDWCAYLLDRKVTRDDVRSLVAAADGARDAVLLPDTSAFDVDDPLAGLRATCEDLAAACADTDAEQLKAFTDGLRADGVLVGGTRTYTLAKLDEALAITRAWVHAALAAHDDDRMPAHAQLDTAVSGLVKRLGRGGGAGGFDEHLDDPDAVMDHPIRAAATALIDVVSPAVARWRAHVAHLGRTELDRRRAQRPGLDFDALVRSLADGLDRPGSGDRLAATLQRRYGVALVDEFQDTDPAQWAILRRLFADRRLAIIGDPKQSIYAFRGADLATYLTVRDHATAHRSLTTSWRTDRPLVQAVTTLFGQTGAFGSSDITAPSLDAAHEAGRLVRGQRPAAALPPGAPLVVRHVPLSLAATDGGLYRNRKAPTMTAGWLGATCARDVAAVTTELLDEGATIDTGDGRRPLSPGDIAVLVRTGLEAQLVRGALSRAGVPVATTAAGSVLNSPEAHDVQDVLAALLAPGSDRVVRAAAATALIGWNATQLHSAGDDAWDRLGDDLVAWRAEWDRDGVAAALRSIMASTGAMPRLLAARGGERRVTDLRHVIELLGAQETAQRRGPEALLAWLGAQRAEEDADLDDETTALRLDRDDDAVSVMTIHASKGLEFGVVLCPSLWRMGELHRSTTRLLTGHDDDRRRWIDCSVDRPVGSPSARRQAQALDERLAEDTRLAYVALTRARHLAVVWSAKSDKTAGSPLAGLLHGRSGAADDLHARGAKRIRSADDAELVGDVTALGDASDGAIACSVVTERPSPARWTPPVATAPHALTTLPDATDVDRWHRTSFSGIKERIDRTRPGGAGPVGAADGDIDRAAADRDADADAAPTTAVGTATPYGRMPGGTAAGSLVHEVLERIGFDADAPAIRAVVEERRARHGIAAHVVDDVVEGVAATLHTPLGPLVGDAVLADVPRTRRLDELAFELVLHRPVDRAWRDVLAVLGEHEGTDAVPSGSVERLSTTRELRLHGYLTGFIDLIAGMSTPVGERLVLVDYKTNALRDAAGAVDPARYSPQGVAGEVAGAAYTLQYLLYCVALRRFLRWRRGSGADWERDVAGVAYLFLRGMTGPDVARDPDGRPFGVHAAAVPEALVDALDHAVCGGAR